MKSRLVAAAALPFAAWLAAAQGVEKQQQIRREVEKLVAESKMVTFSGAVMGPTVKGAPYSAVEVNETNHVLGDGTHIHNATQTNVYRDSEGRVRRETAGQVTIFDPVAGVSYFLDPAAQTARKAPLGQPLMIARSASGNAGYVVGGGVAVGTSASSHTTFEFRTLNDGPTTVVVNGQKVEGAQAKEVLDKMGARLKSGEPPDPEELERLKKRLAEDGLAHAAEPGIVVRKQLGRGEPLGRQTIEGVAADGTRNVNTIETGAIGNDRPIQIVSERWYSPELQMVIQSRNYDPRTGEQVFRLTGISRSEPAADLFQVPASYQIIEGKR